MDNTGFTFAGRHVSQFDAAFLATKWPMAAAATLNKATVPGRHGSLRYPGGTLGEKSLEGILHWTDPDNALITYEEMMDRAYHISAWLQTGKREPLILDAAPDKYYLADVETELPLSTSQWANGACNLKFVLQPFAYALRKVTAQVALAANTAQNIAMHLTGTADAPIGAIVTASAALNWVELAIGGQVLRLENLGMAAGQMLEIKAEPETGELMTVEMGGIPALGKVTAASATPLYASPGQVTVAAKASADCTLALFLRARWT
jgi:predicted phage tail component-like protein